MISFGILLRKLEFSVAEFGIFTLRKSGISFCGFWKKHLPFLDFQFAIIGKLTCGKQISRLHQFLHETKTEELIMKFIQSEALINGEIVKITKGILQGSALSPLLSNFYLCGFDHYLEMQEYPFVRFADDCRIFVRDRNTGERILDDINRWTKENLNLTLNPIKSKVTRVTEMDFFGKVLKTGGSGYTIARKDRKPGNWYAEWTPSPLSFSNGIYHIQEDGILSSRDRTLLFENEDQKIIYPIETVTSINVFGNTIFDKNFFELMIEPPPPKCIRIMEGDSWDCDPMITSLPGYLCYQDSVTYGDTS